MSSSEKLFVYLISIVIALVLMSYPVMWLWNWLMPQIFDLPTITVWEALGLQVLSALLVKSQHSTTKKED